LNSEAKHYSGVLEWASFTVDGFESPLGMELLATVDWLIEVEGVAPSQDDVTAALQYWPGGPEAAQRKLRIFDDRLIGIALDRLVAANRLPL
jgi:hypothetical protein